MRRWHLSVTQHSGESAWDQVSLDWQALDRKLYVFKPTGLSREALWRLLFVARHRANPWQEQECKGHNWRDVWAAWESAQSAMGIYKADLPPFSNDVQAVMRGFGVENEAALQALRSAKDQHACRWQTKEGTYRVKRRSLPDVRDAGGDVLMGDL